MTSRDFGFLTLRNISAYQKNGAVVPPNYILNVSSNGNGIFTNTINPSTVTANTIFASTIDVDIISSGIQYASTVIIDNEFVNFLTVNSTITASTISTNLLISNNIVTQTLSTNLVSSQLVNASTINASTVNTSNVNSNTTSLTLTSLNRIDVVANGDSDCGFISQPADETTGNGTVSIRNGLNSGASTTYTFYCPSQTNGSFNNGDLALYSYSPAGINKCLEINKSGSTITFGQGATIGGCKLYVNGTLGLSRVYDELYNSPISSAVLNVSTILTSTLIAGKIFTNIISTGIVSSQNVVTESLSTNLVSSQIINASTVNTSNVNSNTTSLRLTALSRIDAIADGSNIAGFISQPANETTGDGTVSIRNGLNSGTSTTFTLYCASQNSGGLTAGNFMLFSYSGLGTKKCLEVDKSGSTIVFGDNATSGGCQLYVNGTLGTSRVYDEKYNIPNSFSTFSISSLSANHIVSGTLSTNLVSSQIVNASTVNTSNVISNTTSLTLTSLSRIDVVANGDNNCGFISQPADETIGNGTVSIRNGLTSGASTTYTFYCPSQTGSGLNAGNLTLFSYSDNTLTTANKYMDFDRNGSTITFGEGGITGGCQLYINGTLGTSRVYDEKYNIPNSFSTFSISSLSANHIVSGTLSTNLVLSQNIISGTVSTNLVSSQNVVSGTLSTNLVSSQNIVSGTLSTNLVSSQIVNASTVNTSNVNSNTTSLTLTSLSRIDVVANGDNNCGFISQPADETTGNGTVSIRNGLTSGASTTYTFYCPSQTGSGLNAGNLTLFSYSDNTLTTANKYMDFDRNGSTITFGEGGITGGCKLYVNGTLGTSRVYDEKYNIPNSFSTFSISSLSANHIVSGTLSTTLVSSQNIVSGTLSTNLVSSQNIVSGTLSTNLVSSQIVNASTVNTSNVNSNTTSLTLTSLSRIDVVANGDNNCGFISQPADETIGNGTVSIRNGLNSGASTTYTFYCPSQTNTFFNAGNLTLFSYSDNTVGTAKKYMDFDRNGSTITFGNSTILGGCNLYVNGSLGLGRVYDTKYNFPETVGNWSQYAAVQTVNLSSNTLSSCSGLNMTTSGNINLNNNLNLNSTATIVYSNNNISDSYNTYYYRYSVSTQTNVNGTRTLGSTPPTQTWTSGSYLKIIPPPASYASTLLTSNNEFWNCPKSGLWTVQTDIFVPYFQPGAGGWEQVNQSHVVTGNLTNGDLITANGSSATIFIKQGHQVLTCGFIGSQVSANATVGDNNGISNVSFRLIMPLDIN